MRPSGTGAVHRGSAAEGPEGFPQGGVGLSKASDKNGGLFEQRHTGSFFSHRARQSLSVQRYVKKT